MSDKPRGEKEIRRWAMARVYVAPSDGPLTYTYAQAIDHVTVELPYGRIIERDEARLPVYAARNAEFAAWCTAFLHAEMMVRRWLTRAYEEGWAGSLEPDCEELE